MTCKFSHAVLSSAVCWSLRLLWQILVVIYGNSFIWRCIFSLHRCVLFSVRSTFLFSRRIAVKHSHTPTHTVKNDELSLIVSHANRKRANEWIYVNRKWVFNACSSLLYRMKEEGEEIYSSILRAKKKQTKWRRRSRGGREREKDFYPTL